MTAENVKIFKAQFGLKFDEFVKSPRDNEDNDLDGLDPSEDEDFNLIFDEFAYWYGKMYGI